MTLAVAPLRSLSARLLVLTIGFVMLAEVLIYVPSVARFRQTWLEERLEAAYLAGLALVAAPDHMVDADLEATLLAATGARAITLKQPDRRVLMLSDRMPPRIAAQVPLTGATPWMLIRGAADTLAMADDDYMLVLGMPKRDTSWSLEVILRNGPLKAAMLDFSGRILGLSIVISLFTASLVFLALHLMIVRPMRRLTAGMAAFRAAPEDASQGAAASARGDEIGLAERELARMQHDLRAALKQRTRLAQLGAAVSKINHDLRNILATAQIVTDRLADSADPTVRQIAPRLIDSVDRAIGLCTGVLAFGKAEEAPISRNRFSLAMLIADVEPFVGLPADGRIVWRNQTPPDLVIAADRDQLFRVFLNLGRNAAQAIAGEGEIRFDAVRREGRVMVEIADTGGGLPEAVRAHLFEPFRSTGRSGGTGLGLAIARDLVRAHGGDIGLARTGPLGTTFRLELPDHG